MFGLFKKKKPRSILDELDSVTVNMYRPLLKHKKNTSDDKILEIVQTVMSSFQQASESKGERIPGKVLINICAHFICVYDSQNQDFFMKHVPYEINVYLNSGLRDTYL
ncbi:hypothetical protein [Colwellia sp. BRX8-9]|uniref:hypothetical protein n=1 Tax=Colwellia sp. BRX8-9 TaxID=2759831 RepID=UPI0015F455BA|nr:hypothetical protein [Colwellia sp. BRX8-9]MBA6348339.1 hypothetical protein [Colwellia sp. BRX8-9]